MPAFVVRLTTPPLKRPNSAGGLLVSSLNSWIASTFGKNATWPGSGCSTEMPSNRYSLVRGRPPLIRGSGAVGGGGRATPGTRLASAMKLRPFSGRSTTRRWSMTWPRLPFWLRSIEASAETVTVSVAPTSSATSTRSVSPVATRKPVRTSGRKPCSVTCSSYSPGASPCSV